MLYTQSHRQDSTYHSLCYTSYKKLKEMGKRHSGRTNILGIKDIWIRLVHYNERGTRFKLKMLLRMYYAASKALPSDQLRQNGNQF